MARPLVREIENRSTPRRRLRDGAQHAGVRPRGSQPRIARAGATARARATEAAGSGRDPSGLRSALRRTGLGVLTTLVSVNLWTGGPLLAVWVGSRIQAAAGQLSMAAVGGTVAVLIIETFLLYKALAYLNSRYNDAIGRVIPRQQAPWMKPMSGERRALEVRRPLTATERIVVASVVVAVLALEIWFFFFAHYALPG
jgi:hypothetical protein